MIRKTAITGYLLVFILHLLGHLHRVVSKPCVVLYQLGVLCRQLGALLGHARVLCSHLGDFLCQVYNKLQETYQYTLTIFFSA
jgi:hypothetical protein